MGRRIGLYICFVLLALPVAHLYSQCSPHKIAKDFRPNLLPFKYDSYAYNEVTFNNKPQTIEVVFTAYAGLKYKLVFGTSLFDENVQVNIYDKSVHAKERTKLYDNNSGVDNLFWSKVIDKPGTYYIDYDIPTKGTSQSTDGCMVLLIGYK